MQRAVRLTAEWDHELVARIKAGEIAAFETLFHTYYRPLRAFLMGYLQSEDVANECVQDLLWHLWQNRARWDVTSGLKAYLYTAARNRALNQLRHERIAVAFQALATRDLRFSGLGQAPEAADDRVQRHQLTQALHEAVRRLPKRRREAFTLRWQHHLTNAEIATVMGVSIKNVEHQLMLAMRSLRQSLGRLL